jgi:hypothetical protein
MFMKKLYSVSLAIVLTIGALSLAGCAKDNDSVPSNTVIGNPSVPLPTNPTYPPGGAIPGGTMPVGCYATQFNNCSPCPSGYVQNGSYCTFATTGGGGYYGCQMGTFWNGWFCQQIGYVSSCPVGTSWSWYYYGCVVAVPYGQPAPMSNCRLKTYAGGLLYTYVCF